MELHAMAIRFTIKCIDISPERLSRSRAHNESRQEEKDIRKCFIEASQVYRSDVLWAHRTVPWRNESQGGRSGRSKRRKIKRWKLSIKFEIKFSCHKFLCKKRFSLGMNFWLSDKAKKTFRQALGHRQRMKQWRSFFR